jgi:aryl-alcohol dehydrogenase-like predicted oxidoreductase
LTPWLRPRQNADMSSEPARGRYPQAGLPADLTKYVYGTTRLGDSKIDFEQRVRLANEAMAAGVWFHTSDAYGNALEVLRAAFDRDRARVPKLIVKIGWSDVAELRASIRKNVEPLGVGHIDIGQLCLGGQLAAEFRGGGACYDAFRQIKAEGLVRSFVLEVFPWTSEGPLQAFTAGYPDGVIDACILYLNPLQRFASNALWTLLERRGVPVIAMRTVAGGDVHRLRDVPGAAWKDYLRERAAQVAPIFEASGVRSWVEFCMRFAHGFPLVKASVGATSRPERLAEFLAASKSAIEPLPVAIQKQIVELQYRWSDAIDVQAEPWSM